MKRPKFITLLCVSALCVSGAAYADMYNNSPMGTQNPEMMKSKSVNSPKQNTARTRGEISTDSNKSSRFETSKHYKNDRRASNMDRAKNGQMSTNLNRDNQERQNDNSWWNWSSN